MSGTKIDVRGHVSLGFIYKNGSEDVVGDDKGQGTPIVVQGSVSPHASG
jgi:hypothetical protein